MQKTPTHRFRTTTAAILAVAAVMPVTLTVAKAGEGYTGGGLSSLAQKEMIRRQQAVAKSDALLAEGRDAYAKQDYKQAVDKYKEALNVLPQAPMTEDRREFLVKSLADGSAALGEEYRKTGKYEEARQLANDVLANDPNNRQAKTLIAYLDDPIRTNPALTAEHTANVDKVTKNLYLAEGNYDLGKYDASNKAYEEVLRIDPYNRAARRGMEKNAEAKSKYYDSAYDHTRAELLSQVDAAWELAVPPVVDEKLIGSSKTEGQTSGSSFIMRKLRTIVVPRIDFEDTSVEEAIDFLRLRASELDTLSDPSQKGINFVIRKPRTSSAPAAEAGVEAGAATATLGGTSDPGALRIKELRLTNLPLAEVLRYICDATKLKYKVDDYAVTIIPISDEPDEFVQRTFQVPPDFKSKLEASAGGSGDGGGGTATDPFAAKPDAGGLKKGKDVKSLLIDAGIKFDAGASVQLIGSSLVVRNTANNIDQIESLIETINGSAPKQVKVSTKFVEISQENADELGFDWVVSPFSVASVIGNNYFLGGGSSGSGQARTSNDFVSPVNGTSLYGVPSDSTQNVSQIVTGGLRSGDGAISRNSIDAVLNNPDRSSNTASAAPGILSLTGVFDNSTVQMIMRGLSQKKGTDLMTAPSVTARSNEKAKIEIIREFIYPTEYEPPQLPNSVGTTSSTNLLGGGSSSGSFPVTPATPTSFETRNTGVTLEVEPNIGSSDYVIDLKFIPNITEFEGFVNYGSPIQSSSTDALGNPITITITENRIEMPVFSTRRVETSLTIYDGYTVAIGGLMREDVQQVQDKVPVLGDIPFVGRLFQSNAEDRIKSNLILFVTAQIIDATGRPIRGAGSATAAAGAETVGLGGADASVIPPLTN
jgi:general secretion pathway protein D